MTPSEKGVFAFDPISHHPFKGRLWIRFTGFAMWLGLKAIGPTLRYEFHGAVSLDRLLADHGAIITCVWHDCLLTGFHYLRKRRFVVLTSQNFDAEFAARCAIRFGYGTVRGSSSRGGTKAFAKLARSLEEGHPAILAVDGPRGPLHVVKRGAPVLARTTGKTIIAAVIRPDRSWTFPTWDKLFLPKPFSRVVVFVGEPIRVSADATRDEIEDGRGKLQNELQRISAEVDRLITQGRHQKQDRVP